MYVVVFIKNLLRADILLLREYLFDPANILFTLGGFLQFWPKKDMPACRDSVNCGRLADRQHSKSDSASVGNGYRRWFR